MPLQRDQSLEDLRSDPGFTLFVMVRTKNQDPNARFVAAFDSCSGVAMPNG
jgi:hypothetical protein